MRPDRGPAGRPWRPHPPGNTGQLATHIARGADLAGNREDVVWLIGDRDKITFLQGGPFQELGVIAGTLKVPGYSGPVRAVTRRTSSRGYMPYNPYSPFMRGMSQSDTQQGREQTGPTREVKWIVAVEGNTPLKVLVSSQKGGTKVKNVTFN